jgi:hypothetical protein
LIDQQASEDLPRPSPAVIEFLDRVHARWEAGFDPDPLAYAGLEGVFPGTTWADLEAEGAAVRALLREQWLASGLPDPPPVTR